MDNLEEEIKEIKEFESIKEPEQIKTPLEIIIYFLNICNIKCSNIDEINGIIIPREILLSDEIEPKRVCDGYTKDGIKKYKRFFEIKK